MSGFTRAVGAFFRILATGGERFVPARLSNPAHGIAYVYRPSSKSAVSPGIRLDGQDCGVLSEGGYLHFELEPGVHEIGLVLSERWSGKAAARFQVEAGGTSYVRVESYISGGGTPEHRYEIAPVPAATGESEIGKCRARDRDREKYKKSHLLNN